MESLDRLSLVSGTLGAEVEHPHTEVPKLCVVVLERTRLRGVSPGARDLVPPL
jgi:hypothetical protein